MNLSIEHLERLGAQTRFPPQTLEKVIRLGEIAADTARHPLLSRVLALKGGTALNLMFGPPARLSVDLDFNYIGGLDRNRLDRERPEVERAVEIVARGRGYRVQRSRDAHAGRKLYLAYRSATGTRDRIEVDLNYLFRVPLGTVSSRSLWQPPGIERPELAVVPPEELFAGKLRATLDLAMPRDLFDILRLPHYAGSGWGTSRFHRLHVALAVTLPRRLAEYGPTRFERVTDRHIREQLLPMLQTDVQPTAADLRNVAWRIVAPLLELDDAEQEFLARAYNGELNPELLFPDDTALVERVKQHPAIRWKIENLKKHRSG